MVGNVCSENLVSFIFICLKKLRTLVIQLEVINGQIVDAQLCHVIVSNICGAEELSVVILENLQHLSDKCPIQYFFNVWKGK